MAKIDADTEETLRKVLYAADRRQSAIVICGHLMLVFADPAKRTQWYDYLDDLWEQIEDRP